MDDRNPPPPRLALLDLVDAKQWQRLQDHFAEVIGLAIRTVSPSHELLVNPSWPAHAAVDQLIAALRVGEELDQLIPLLDPPCDTCSLTVPLGVTYAAVPIRATDRLIPAYIVLGPMVVGRREDEQPFRQRVAAMGLDAPRLWSLLLSLKLYTFAGIRSVLNLMEDVGAALVQVAYQAKQSRVTAPATRRIDQALVSYYTDRVFSSLLDVATKATKAEGGSVMRHNPQTGTFQISVSCGLSEQVVKTAVVRDGEGLVGLAAQERRILVVDDRVPDNRIRARMRRPELASSLVAPVVLETASQPVGVLSLRTSDPARCFTGEHVELMQNLLDLAGMALGNLQTVIPRTDDSSES